MEISTSELLTFYILVLVNTYSFLQLPKVTNLFLALFFLSFYYLAEYFHTVRYRKHHSFLFACRMRHPHFVALSLLEHVLANRLASEWFKKVGVLLCVIGQTMRMVAEFTLQRHFNTTIQYQKKEEHSLCTTGIYRFFRHPSYTGWFYWSLGLQLILNNVFCLVVGVLVSAAFFDQRTKYEEQKLEQFFGNAYRRFKETTWVLIPKLTASNMFVKKLAKYNLFPFATK